MRLTVCELSHETLSNDWPKLLAHSEKNQSDLVLLPEMIFSPWLPATNLVSAESWVRSVAEHKQRLAQLNDLSPAVVIATIPTLDNGIPRHESVVCQPNEQPRRVHQKYYLPDDDGFFEATWYERGDGVFDTFTAAGAVVGMAMCTELWFTEQARSYAKAGVEVIASPRCTGAESLDRWLAAGRISAIMAGAFSMSSNRSGTYEGVGFGGMGWVIDPDGEVLATTTANEPFVTVEVDLVLAAKAKKTYPRYVME